MKISIAMATFNGAKYIQEQLESLINQIRQPDELVVCDDGSTDNTLVLLDLFSTTAPFPVRIYRNDKNLGYSDNFLKAAKLCEGDWIAFCDQDDVWLPNRLEAAAGAISQYPDLTMVLQNSLLCDAHLDRRGRIFPDRIKPGCYGPNAQYGFWVWLGFLQTVKADLFTQLDSASRPPNYFPGHVRQSHDKWTCMISAALGGICILSEPAALYRRHESALTGNYAGKNVRERIIKSRAVSDKHYLFLEEVARHTSAYLCRLAEEATDADWRGSFNQSGAYFQRLADIQACRAALYGAVGVLVRATCFLRIWQNGGYIGPRFTAMGVGSAFKDAARVVFGAGIMTRTLR